MNKLLKPICLGDSLMIHAFPSQITEDYRHWAINIRSHECLFSKKSLSILCAESGFILVDIRNDSNVQHPLYYFSKIKDVEL
jgi:hypothetical protein